MEILDPPLLRFSLFLRTAVDWDPTDTSTYTCDGDPDLDQGKTNVDKLKAVLEEKLRNGECKEDYPIATNDTHRCYWLKEQIKVILFFSVNKIPQAPPSEFQWGKQIHLSSSGFPRRLWLVLLIFKEFFNRSSFHLFFVVVSIPTFSSMTTLILISEFKVKVRVFWIISSIIPPFHLVSLW